ncbi:hypothetical protein pb186bvf_015680 [Paramecium bursaria]
MKVQTKNIGDRPNSRDSPQRKKKQYAYGQLKFGDVKIKTKKLNIKTFFGNPEQDIFCVKFDYDDSTIVAGCSDGTVKVFNLLTGKLTANLQGSSEGQTPTTCLSWRRDNPNKLKGVFLSGNSDGSIMYWHAASGKQLTRIVEKNSILCMDLRSDGEVFATAGQDFKIRIYDDEKKEVIRVFEQADYHQPGHVNRVFALKFLQDQPTVFMSGGWDGNVLIWDLREEKSIGNINGPNLTGDALDYKNGQILTGSYRTNDQLQLWDFKQRTLISEIKWDPEKDLNDYYIYSCQFSKINPDTIMAGSSGRQELKIFDTQNGYQPCVYVEDIQEGIYAVDYGNKTNRLAFGGGEGVVYVCSLVTQK